jgi:aminoglycoside phosphotransferase (APT) family kinase protein
MRRNLRAEDQERMGHAPSNMLFIGEGYGSRVYATGDGNILRVAKNRLTQRNHRRERAVLGILKPYIHSIAIPEPSIFIPSSEEYPYGAIGYKRIPGRPLQPADITGDQRQPLAEQIAFFIDELHQIPVTVIADSAPLSAYLPAPRKLHSLWTRVGAYVLQNAPGVYPELAEAFAKCAKTVVIKRREPQVLLHGDLWYENMIYCENKLAGVIDFEAVSFGYPIVDFMTQGYIDHDFMQLVVAAYQRYGAFEYDEDLGACLMFLRELGGLDCGIQTESVDRDSLQKIEYAAGKL